MNYSSSLTPSWRARALSVAAVQGALANSPAELDLAGRPILCAASCIAYAGLMEIDESVAADFVRRIVESPKKEEVVAAYRKLGLPAELAEATLAQNDSTAREARIALFYELLQA